jgi:hypothetical protein
VKAACNARRGDQVEELLIDQAIAAESLAQVGVEVYGESTHASWLSRESAIPGSDVMTAVGQTGKVKYDGRWSGGNDVRLAAAAPPGTPSGLPE